MHLVHNVYFALHDNSAAAKEKLIASAHKYLSGHPGTVYFSVGKLAEEYARPVNDRNYDVALHVVFDGRESHDAYQIAPRHLEFIAEGKENWKTVRVFDSDAS